MTDKEKFVKVGMFISDIPLGVYKKFKVPCEERCGDTYWVRLKELIEKEEELDKLKQKVE